MTASQRKKLEEFAAGDRPLNRAIAAALAELTAKAEPPRPAAIVRLYDPVEVHAFESYEDAMAFVRSRAGEAMRTDGPWTWHSARGETCEHGVPEGTYCAPCNAEYKRAARAAEGETPS